MTSTIKFTAILAVIAIIAAMGLFINVTQGQGITGGAVASDCDISTSTIAGVGDDSATSVLSGHSRRAWATIQQPDNATNTVSISFGSTAVAGQGLTLSSSTPSDRFEFGLNTDMPYTGSVSVITDTGSSTVIVVECRY